MDAIKLNFFLDYMNIFLGLVNWVEDLLCMYRETKCKDKVLFYICIMFNCISWYLKSYLVF